MTTSDNLTGTGEESTREDIPLKTGSPISKWYGCGDDCLSGSKFINVAFGTLTFIITVALLVQIHYGDYQVVPHGSVATDSLECSRIGTKVLKQGGNAVDAAIASTFCLAVVVPHLTSLDGDGQILIYNHRTRLPPNVIDFSSDIESDELPKLVLGLAYIHQLYGKLSWKDLVLPSAVLAKKGYVISKMLAQAVNRAKAQHLFGRLEPGQLLHHELLSDTLAHIANITENHLYSYINPANTPVQSQAVKSNFHNFDVFVPKKESPGPILLVNLREIEENNFTNIDVNAIKKILYTTLKVYEEFNATSQFHQGTSTNVAVMDLDDNYVSLVTGMYGLFGSKQMTPKGYVLNENSRQTRCGRIPLIITDSKLICGKRFALGANSIAQATQLISNLVVGHKNASEAVEGPRFYLLDNLTVAVEAFHSPKFNIELLAYLKQIQNTPILMPEPYDSSNIVAKIQDDLSSHSDSRGGGIASRF